MVDGVECLGYIQKNGAGNFVIFEVIYEGFIDICQGHSSRDVFLESKLLFSHKKIFGEEGIQLGKNALLKQFRKRRNQRNGSVITA